MVKNNTASLSNKELDLIENLIFERGSLVTFDNIYQKLGKNKTKQEVKNIISKLVKKGWLVRIKKSTYIITEISDRGTINLNQLALAHIINNDSYISFEAALSHYGLFDQYLRTIKSIGKKRTYIYKYSNWIFKYFKVKDGMFGDYMEYSIDGQLVKVATKEKAIIDMLTYKRTIHSVDLVIEKLLTYKDEFDFKKIIEISKKSSITIKRILGFILDSINVDSNELYEDIKNNNNYSYMTKDSNLFNSKWRLYINEKFLNK